MGTSGDWEHKAFAETGSYLILCVGVVYSACVYACALGVAVHMDCTCVCSTYCPLGVCVCVCMLCVCAHVLVWVCSECVCFPRP